MNRTPLSLGLRANLTQFSLLVLVNAFDGGMVGGQRRSFECGFGTRITGFKLRETRTRR